MSADADQLKLHTPYWRLDDDARQAEGLASLVRRLRLAIAPVMHVLRQAAPRSAMAVLLTQLFSGIAAAGVLFFTSRVLAELFASGNSSERVHAALPELSLLVAVYVFHLAMDAATQLARAHMIPKVHRFAEEELYRASLDVDLASFDDPGFYDQLHRARDRGVMHIEGATACLIEILTALSAVAGAVAALLWLHPLLVLLLCVALLPEGWAALHSARIQYAGMPTTIALTRQTQMMAELATQREAAPEIRANQTQDYVLSEYRKTATALQDHLVRLGIAEARAMTVGRLLAAAGLTLTFVALGLMLHAEWLDLAVAGTAVLAIRNSSASLSRLMRMANELFEKGLYISDYREFIERARARAPVAHGRLAPARPGRICVENVTFRYPGTGDRVAIRDVSLTIEPGKTVAFVGENGSGKTTLGKLIAGLYRPNAGRVTWDGIDLREIRPDSLAERVAIVQQQPVRWPRSAEDNVRLGRYSRHDPELQALLQAAAQARAQEVIETLPEGWNTLLSREFRGGQDLSAGQWQRLAVARGLYRDAPLVIWDEPTAPLDAKAEHAVYESLRRLANGRTVILITHRLTSIRSVDRIFLLDRGMLAEQGTHEELLRLGGCYAELYRLQAKLHQFQVL